MKKILINEKNKEKIQEILLTSRGKAKERLINYEDLEQAVKIGNARANWILVKQRKGLCFAYSMNEKMPSAYKYSYEADVVDIEWTSKGWALIAHYRKSFWPNTKNPSKFYWKLTAEDEAWRAEEIKNDLYKSFINL